MCVSVYVRLSIRREVVLLCQENAIIISIRKNKCLQFVQYSDIEVSGYVGNATQSACVCVCMCVTISRDGEFGLNI